MGRTSHRLRSGIHSIDTDRASTAQVSYLIVAHGDITAAKGGIPVLGELISGGGGVHREDPINEKVTKDPVNTITLDWGM